MINTGLIVVICIGGIIVAAVLSLSFTHIKEWVIRNTRKKNTTSSVSGNLVRDMHTPILERYKMSKTLLGKGASAECYVGVDITTKREYAIKTVDTHDEKVLKFYEREIQVLKDLEHLNIVRLYEVYHGPNSLHFVMELCVGGHLGEALASRPDGRFEETVAQAYIAQLVGAVNHCHQHGICHRDIKLQNILLENRARDAQIKLIDFGNSKRFSITPSSPDEPVFTRMAGTTYTMAPEVFRGEYDERCDIWSIGVVCFILLSGERPFESIEIPNQPDASKSSLVSNILMGRYSFRSSAWDMVNQESIEFTQLCLTMDYKKRPTAAELHKMDWCSPEIANRTLLTEKATRTLTRRLSRAVDTGLGRTSMLAVAFSMPSNKARELRSLFQQIDVDGSGQVDLEEFCTALRTTEPNMTDEQIRSLFEAIDQDGNEQISFLEFVAAMVDPREVDINEINQAFKLLDQEGKGYISHKDVYRLLATSFGGDSSAEGGAPATRRPSIIDALRRSNVGGDAQVAPLLEEENEHPKVILGGQKMPSFRGPSFRGGVSFRGNVQLGNFDSDVVKEQRLKRLQSKVQNIIEQADQNGDGKISYAEFVLAMTGQDDASREDPSSLSKQSSSAGGGGGGQRRKSYDKSGSSSGEGKGGATSLATLKGIFRSSTAGDDLV